MGSAELTPAHTRTGGSCTKAAGRLSEPSTCKLCGRRSTMSGRRGPRPSCPSGSVSALARRPESPTPLRTTTREVPMSQLKRKRRRKRRMKRKRRKKRKRRRKKRKNKCFLTRLPPTKTSPPQSISPHHCFTPRATIITSTSHFSSLRTNEKKNRLAKIKISSQPTGNLRAIAAHLSTAGKINNNIDSDLLFKCFYNMCFVTAPTL